MALREPVGLIQQRPVKYELYCVGSSQAMMAE